MDDQRLVERLAARDPAAVSTAFDRFAQPVFNLAYHILQDRTEAEDVLQETFLEVWRAAASFRPERGGPAAWVFGIARNRAIDRLRARATRRAGGGNGNGGAVVAEAPAGDLAPDEVIAGREEGAIVRSALAGLPAEQRLAIELAYFGGLSQSEIAERLGAPLGTVKTRIRLGLERLRHALHAFAGEARS